MILPEQSVHFNWTDITMFDKTNKKAAFIDTTITLTHSLQARNAEKQPKYQEMTL
jgi:hypothetical protein